jgi:hypothetical protein
MDVPRYLSSREIVIPLSVETLQSANIDEYVTRELNNRLTGLHNGEGIVLPGTIRMMYRSSPQLDTMTSTLKRLYGTCLNYYRTFSDPVRTVFQS